MELQQGTRRPGSLHSKFPRRSVADLENNILFMEFDYLLWAALLTTVVKSCWLGSRVGEPAMISALHEFLLQLLFDENWMFIQPSNKPGRLWWSPTGPFAFSPPVMLMGSVQQPTTVHTPTRRAHNCLRIRVLGKYHRSQARGCRSIPSKRPTKVVACN
jgi:hypothetical protein